MLIGFGVGEVRVFEFSQSLAVYCVAVCCEVTCARACTNHDLIEELVRYNLFLSSAGGIDPVQGLHQVLDHIENSIRYACLLDRVSHDNLVLVKVFPPADNLLVQICAWDQTVTILIAHAKRDVFVHVVQKPSSAFPGEDQVIATAVAADGLLP